MTLIFVYLAFSKKLMLSKGKSLILISSLVLYALYSIGTIYTPYLDSALIDLRIKSALFFIPLLFLFDGKNKSLWPGNKNVSRFFVAGISIYLIYCIIRSFYFYLKTKDFSVFFYEEFTPFEQHAYVALITDIAIAILFFYKEFFKNTYVRVVLYAVLLSSLFFLSSRGGILALFLLLGIYFVYQVFIGKKRALAFKSIGIILFFTIIFSWSSPVVRSGLMRLYQNPKVFSEGKKEDSGEPRLLIWEISWSLYKEKPVLGYGTGSVSEILTKVYAKNDYEEYATKRWNAHNQYLQTVLSIGAIGGIVLLFSLLLPFFISIRKRESLVFSALFLFMINLFTESMLERQTGVCLFVIVLAIAFHNLEGNKSKQIE
ncbi:MAG: O-antigen ligase family protein [Bacteroidales bacterium]